MVTVMPLRPSLSACTPASPGPPATPWLLRPHSHPPGDPVMLLPNTAWRALPRLLYDQHLPILRYRSTQSQPPRVPSWHHGPPHHSRVRIHCLRGYLANVTGVYSPSVPMLGTLCGSGQVPTEHLQTGIQGLPTEATEAPKRETWQSQGCGWVIPLQALERHDCASYTCACVCARVHAGVLTPTVFMWRHHHVSISCQCSVPVPHA
jgi:hypothetical protein